MIKLNPCNINALRDTYCLKISSRTIIVIEYMNNNRSAILIFFIINLQRLLKPAEPFWAFDRPVPKDHPDCGFHNELCSEDYTGNK